MIKRSLIINYFQKVGQLAVQNSDYTKTLSSLFRWMIAADGVSNDSTTKQLDMAGMCTAKIVSNGSIVVSGLEEIAYLLKTHSTLSFQPNFKDGEKLPNGKTIATIQGDIREILAYERTVLNILARMSGIATTTNRLVSLLNQQSTLRLRSGQAIINHPYIAATRKTPWMLFDKKAVAVGGGLTHRLNLEDGILVKDNHLTAVKKMNKLKTTKEAVQLVLTTLLVKHNNELIEIEVTSYDEAYSALYTWFSVVTNNQKLITNNHLALLLDNFTPSQAKKVIRRLGRRFDLSEIIIEASGGIDEGKILEWAAAGVDVLSLGSLTHSARAANISLDLVESDESEEE